MFEKIWNQLSLWLQRVRMTEEESYLSRSVDIADYERRVKIIANSGWSGENRI